jgi:hypothetical protein
VLAIVKIRGEPHYRREAFCAGLRRVGYTVVERGVPSGRQDFLVQWNRKLADEPEAHAWEASGGSVLVAENGYVGKDEQGRQNYALAVHAHNGAGWFPVGAEDRFSALGVAPKPWRSAGEHVLVCAQRGIGSAQMRSPAGWHEAARYKLRKTSTRRVQVRLHPGMAAPTTTLEQDLTGAWACVIWSSGSGVKALLSGIPVFYDAPHWICELAATQGLADLESPVLSDDLRLLALQRMAHAQWSVSELETGEPFARIRDRIGEASW